MEKKCGSVNLFVNYLHFLLSRCPRTAKILVNGDSKENNEPGLADAPR